MEVNNTIDLNVGDVFRENGARKHHKVVNIFDYEGETYIVYKGCDKGFSNPMEIREKKYLCAVDRFYGNVWGGIVEVNGYKVRGTAGKLLGTPKMVVKKEKVVKTSADGETRYRVYVRENIFHKWKHNIFVVEETGEEWEDLTALQLYDVYSDFFFDVPKDIREEIRAAHDKVEIADHIEWYKPGCTYKYANARAERYFNR